MATDSRNSKFSAALTVLLSLLSGQAMAQSPKEKGSGTATAWKAPRTRDGHPDLQGVWTNNIATPLERPKVLAGRAYLTDQEVAAFKKKAA